MPYRTTCVLQNTLSQLNRTIRHNTDLKSLRLPRQRPILGGNRMRTFYLTITGLFCLTVTGAGSAPKLASLDGAACMDGPVAQFGRYVGDWRIEDEQLARDGSGWGPGKGARWIFKCVGDGTAVQDYWLPNGGGFGTNLRTYNPDSGKWEIVWATTALNGLMHISAEINDAGHIVMDILSPEQDPPRRIIFYVPDEGGWNWAQEWSLDDGATWFEVYRIRATAWQDPAG